MLAGILDYISNKKIIEQTPYRLFDVGELHIKSIPHFRGAIQGMIPCPVYSQFKTTGKTYGYGVPGILVKKLHELG